jgi:hypothetical protein
MRQRHTVEQAKFLMGWTGKNLTRVEADWAWLIHSVMPAEIDKLDKSVRDQLVVVFTTMYVDAATVPGETWRVRLLDAALRSQPWRIRRDVLDFFLASQRDESWPGHVPGLWLDVTAAIAVTIWDVLHPRGDRRRFDVAAALADYHVSLDRQADATILFARFNREIRRSRDPIANVKRLVPMLKGSKGDARDDHGIQGTEGNAVPATGRSRKGRRQAKTDRTLVHRNSPPSQ